MYGLVVEGRDRFVSIGVDWWRCDPVRAPRDGAEGFAILVHDPRGLRYVVEYVERQLHGLNALHALALLAAELNR